MRKLNLPIIKGRVPDAKWLSMDDYLKFVILHLKYTFDKEISKKWKELSAVHMAFSIKKKR